METKNEDDVFKKDYEDIDKDFLKDVDDVIEKIESNDIDSLDKNNEDNIGGFGDHRFKFLSQSVLLSEHKNQNLFRYSVFVILTFFLIFIIWAYFTMISEITKASGVIIPSGYVRIIQHIDGGIVEDIKVTEGELVEKGGLLMKLDGVGVLEDLNGLEYRQISSKLEAIRLRAFANDITPDYSDFDESYLSHILDEKRTYEAMVGARESEIKVLFEQIKQKQSAVESLQGQKLTLELEINVAKEIYSMEQKAQKSGAASRIELLRARKEVNRIDGEINEVDSDVKKSKQITQEYMNRKESVLADYKDKALQDLSNVEAIIAENNEKLIKLRGRVERLRIISPVRGLVKGLNINTIGSVVKPAEKIMEIVPIDDLLVVEVKIQPEDIGHLIEGQNVRIKVSSYDFSRYGIINARLDSISATTFQGRNVDSFYKAKIILEKDYVGNDPDRNKILPGMTVEADIVTGNKSVLSYLLKPVHLYLSNSFTER